MMRRRRTALTAAMLMALAACGGAPGEPEPPAGLNTSVPAQAASIIGEVTQVERANGAVRILVEQVPTRSAGYPIAWINVSSGTRVLVRVDGQAPRAGSAADLADGAKVQAWFTGAVRESYPVQADAATILVER